MYFMKLDLVCKSKYEIIIQDVKEDHCKMKVTITKNFSYTRKLSYINQ